MKIKISNEGKSLDKWETLSITVGHHEDCKFGLINWFNNNDNDSDLRPYSCDNYTDYDFSDYSGYKRITGFMYRKKGLKPILLVFLIDNEDNNELERLLFDAEGNIDKATFLFLPIICASLGIACMAHIVESVE